MPINLTKGQKVDLTKGNPSLTKIVVGLGWDVNVYDSGAAFDLDAAAFMTNSAGKCPTEKEFVFYGNLEHVSGSVKHMGDNLTGEGDGDDEQIVVIVTSPAVSATHGIYGSRSMTRRPDIRTLARSPMRTSTFRT